MNRKIVAAVVLSGIMSLAGDAHAEWSEAGAVTKIRYDRDSYQGGDVLIYLNGTGCSATNNYFRLSNAATTPEDLDAMVRLLTTSRVSGLPVQLGFSRSGGTCQVYSVALE